MSIDTDLLKKAKEVADIYEMPLSKFMSVALVELIDRFDSFTPEEKAKVIGGLPGRRALSTEEFARRAVEREKAIRALRMQAKELPKGKTLDEMDEDEAPKKDPFFLAGVDDDPFLKELERQAMIEHGLTPPTGKPDGEARRVMPMAQVPPKRSDELP